MVRKIMRDEAFLSQRAEPASLGDLEVARDLLDTLAAHRDGCVGMAANMIGVNKRVIVFDNEGTDTVLFNPEIVKNLSPTRRRRAVCPFPASARFGDGNRLRCGIKTRGFSSGSKPSPAGRPRSSSTKSTIAKGC